MKMAPSASRDIYGSRKDERIAGTSKEKNTAYKPNNEPNDSAKLFSAG